MDIFPLGRAIEDDVRLEASVRGVVVARTISTT
jgi:hypothetical protein